jgi:hypothetical protein
MGDDWRPPKSSGVEDVTIERWKLDALLRGAFNRSMTDLARADSAAAVAADIPAATAGPPEKSPPPLAADADEESEEVPAALIRRIEDVVDTLERRIDACEKRVAAHRVLTDLEDEIDRSLSEKERSDSLLN